MKAHRTDNLSLFFGVLFLLISGGYLLHQQFDLQLPEVGWFVAGGLVFLGLVMAVTAMVPSRKTEPVTEPALEPAMEPGLDAAPQAEQRPVENP